MTKNRLQPQATDMEQAVLGAMMLETECFHLISDILQPDDFYVDANRYIFEAIRSLAGKQQPVDILTVTEELLRRDKLDVCGGAYYISQLTSNIAGTAHIEHHALVVKEKAHARRLIRIASQLADKAYDPANDIYELQEQFEKEFTELMAGAGTSLSWDMPQTLKKAVRQAEEKEERRLNGQSTAIPTGISELDKATDGGWKEKDLIILGARPSMGKTQLALWFARAAAEAGYNVGIASIEMAPEQLVNRYILTDERISPYHYRTGQMDSAEWEAVDETVASLWNLPIRIAGDYSIRNLNNIRSESRRLRRKGLLDFLIIDYIGLIRTGLKFERRSLEVGYITGELKNLAKELDIPILVLSQLSRPSKLAIPKMPTMEDLRESGDIEQDADLILMIHKPDYYNPDSIDSSGKSWKNRGQLHLAKYREGQRAVTIIYEHDDRYKKIF